MKQAPLVKGLPLLGSLLPLSQNPLMFLLKAYQDYGTVFRLQVMRREMLVLAGIEANRCLMQAGAEFAKGGIYGGFNQELGQEAHFSTVDGAAHLRLRQAARAGYARSRLALYLPEIIEAIRRHIYIWQSKPSVDLMSACESLALDIVGVALTHYDARPYGSDIQNFVKWLHWVYPMRVLPQVALRLPYYQRAKRRVFEMADAILAQHPTPANQARDLIDDLLQSPLERHQIVGQTISPYFVGIDTIASTCAFMIYLLVKHPQYLVQVRELARDYLVADELKPPPLLKGVIQETIRLYPIAPLVVRRAETEFEFDGYSIEQRTELVFATAVCHYLPQFFPEPYNFCPDRPTAQVGTFSGWGLGVHTCLGAGMAETLLALIASVLLTETDITFVPANYRLRQRLAPIPSPSGLRIKVQSRGV